jgi:AcrR family transcriptional regulator
MQAGLELLGTRGWAATTMRGVCVKAGLNDRYFHESFADMDALLLAVVDDQAAQGTAVIIAVAESAPRDLAARTEAVITAITDFLLADPRRARILVHELPANALLQERRRRIVQNLAVIFTVQAHRLMDEVPVSDTDLQLTALTVVGGLWELLTAWFRGDLATDRDHLVDYMVAFLLTMTELGPVLRRRSG